MTTQTTSRKRAFRSACVLAGTSLSAWAVENGVSRTHLYAVLEGERTPSAELTAKIDALLESAQQAA